MVSQICHIAVHISLAITPNVLNKVETNEEIYNLENYHHEKKIRLHSGGGGISLFMDTNFHYNNRDDLSVFYDVLESLFIELQTAGKDPNTIVGVIYRPPGKNLADFNEQIEVILEKN